MENDKLAPKAFLFRRGFTLKSPYLQTHFMTNMNYKFLYIFYLLFVLLKPSAAQIDRELMNPAEQAIYDLHNGTAIVRLYMNKPKVRRLEEMLSRNNLSDKDRARLQKQMDAHIKDRTTYAVKTIKAFHKHYNFTRVLFIPDYLTNELYKGATSGIFFNDKAEIDPYIKLETTNFFIIGRENRDEDFVVLDARGKPLPPGFPSKVSLTVIDGIGLLFERRLPKTLKKLNNRHHKFYNEVIDKYRQNGHHRTKKVSRR